MRRYTNSAANAANAATDATVDLNVQLNNPPPYPDQLTLSNNPIHISNQCRPQALPSS
jgi:hypothetical protein